MKLSELVEKITSKHYDIRVYGSYFNDSYIDTAITVVDCIKNNRILTIMNDDNNVCFIIKEKGLVDSDLIDDIYNRIKEKEINVDFEEYIIRMCSIINVYTFALSKNDVF